MIKRVLAVLGAGVIAGLATAHAQMQDRVEAQNPKFEGIEVRMLKDNLITRSLDVEGLRLHLYGGELYLLDDNIYNATSNETDDSIWLSVFGTQATYSTNLFEFNLSGKYRDWNYNENDAADYEDHSLSGDVTFDMSDAVDVRVGGSTSDENNPVDPEFGGQDVEYTVNRANAGLTLTPDPRYGMDVDWRYKEKSYDEDTYESLDYDDSSVEAAPYYNISPDTRLLTSVLYGSTSPDNDAARDGADYAEGQIGLLHSITPKVQATAKAGYHDRDYDNTASPQDTDYDDVVGRVALTYEPTELFKTQLSVARTPREASSYHFYELTRTAASATYTPVDALKLTGRLSYDDVAPSDGTEETQLYGGELAVTYALNEYLTLGGSYEYTEANSDAQSREYDRNILSAGAWVNF